MKKEIFVILDNVRSVHNVGAIFRTADAAGASKLYLCGYTPEPIDRFGRVRKDVHKAALGAEKTVSWEKRDGALELIQELKNDGVEIIAVEQDAHAKNYKKVSPKFPTAFVFGNEVDGISKEILDLADVIAEIPMKGKKESLNVSVTVGIILFGI